MPTPLRRRIRHARRVLGYGVLVALILFAVLVGTANQLLPWVERHPESIAAWLSERVGEPVRFSHARAEWTRRGPRFTLQGLRIGQGEQALDIGRAQLQVAMYSGLLPGYPLTELKIRELSLSLVQDDDGRWRAIGLPGQGGGADSLDRLEGFGELQIEKARLAVRSPRLKLDFRLPRVDVRLRVNGNRLRVGAMAWASVGSDPISAVLDMRRRTGSGLLWVGGEDLVLAQWAPMLAPAGVVPRAGTVELGLWTELHNQRVRAVTAEVDVQNLVLASRDVLAVEGQAAQAASVRFERVRARLRWLQSGETWRLHAPVLNFSQGTHSAHLDGLRLQGGKRFGLLGDELDLAPLASLLALSDRLSVPLRVFLSQSQPSAVLHGVSIQGSEGRLHGEMRISALSLRPSRNTPGVSGAGGRVRFDERGGTLSLDTDPIHFDWPAGFLQPLDFRADGVLAWRKQGRGWAMGTNGLRLRGEGLDTHVRAELGLQGDHSAPTLALAAEFDPFKLSTAKKFWVRHKMSAGAVKWLDEALVQGDVLDGRVVVNGDLDDWPFRDGGGVFDARARIENVTLKFSDHWPAAQNMSADLVFNGLGFGLEGAGVLMGNRIDRVGGGIADFKAPWLELNITGNGSGERLRQLMMASPLNQSYGEHLRAASIQGETQVALALKLPMKQDLGEKTIEGSVDFSRARLADSRWGISFTNVNGRTRFSQDGFATENLKVQLDGQPGVFNLRVGDFAGEPDLAALATLEGKFTGQTLIKRYEDMAWLNPWMSGASDWQIAVRVPKTVNGRKTPPSQLRVGSDLSGIALSFPAPLNKSSLATLPLVLQTALPVEDGEIALSLGNLMRLRAVLRAKQAINGTLQFGEGPIVPPPPRGLSVRGEMPSLNAEGWIAYSADGEGSETLHDIDVRARRLDFLDYPFVDTRLRVDRGQASTQVRIDGPGIQGSVEVPSDASQAIQGKFSQLHFVSEPTAAVDSSTAAAKSTATPTPEGFSTDVEDPSKLPPMHFAIADLRLGTAQLGRAELATAPIDAGMRVDKFQTRAPTQDLDAAGEWVRAPGGGTQSNFRLEFKADSLGSMLDALGFTGMVQGGKTKATVTGAWPGSPGAFSLATMTGTLKAEVGEGRLLDVEPGGSGRILGLISLAEIPRRLSLDFSDFFAKGFAFNTARGDFVFNNGQARTDNLRIDGPAAEIRVSGVTGLRDQTYDQRVEVLPKAGGLLPAIGMLAGGPAGAAVGAMAQAVLNKPLKHTTRVVYRVTGPWREPKVDVIEKGPPRGSVAESGPEPPKP
jgi:uncharacterized protein (TIGR02099 family)